MGPLDEARPRQGCQSPYSSKQTSTDRSSRSYVIVTGSVSALPASAPSSSMVPPLSRASPKPSAQAEAASYPIRPWQCLNFFPDPQGHNALRGVLRHVAGSSETTTSSRAGSVITSTGSDAAIVNAGASSTASG